MAGEGGEFWESEDGVGGEIRWWAVPTLLFLLSFGFVGAFEDFVDGGLEGVHGAGLDLRLVDGAADVDLEKLALGAGDEVADDGDFGPVGVVGGEGEGHAAGVEVERAVAAHEHVGGPQFDLLEGDLGAFDDVMRGGVAEGTLDGQREVGDLE